MCHNSYKCPRVALMPTSAFLLYVNYTSIFIFACEREANDKKKLPWGSNEGWLCVDKLHVQKGHVKVLFHLIWPLSHHTLKKRSEQTPNIIFGVPERCAFTLQTDQIYIFPCQMIQDQSLMEIWGWTLLTWAWKKPPSNHPSNALETVTVVVSISLENVKIYFEIQFNLQMYIFACTLLKIRAARLFKIKLKSRRN